MKLYEYQAKELLRAAGIPVPGGRVVASPDEAAAACAELGPVALKVQVLAGGRGKAGGILFAGEPAEARAAARRLLGSTIREHVVERLLVEEKLSFHAELYLGVAVDGPRRRPLLLASAMGGVNIEDVPDAHLVKLPLDIRWGLLPYQARYVATRLGLTGDLWKQATDVALRLYGVWRRYDAELVEINPLVIRADGRVTAADARMTVDDDALFRQQDLPKVEEGSPLELRVKALGLSYVELEGDIAVMANGAGITMATLDVIQRYGGRPANFMDAGGGASVEPTARAIEALLSTNPAAILINIFGGITRCDDVAKAIAQVKGRIGIGVPLVVRLVGTNEAAGVELLRSEGIEAYRSMDEAAAKVVALAGGGA